MTQKFSRRTLIRAVSFLTVAFLVVCGLAISKSAEARQYKRYVELNNAHAFAELSTAVDGINTALQKSLYATSPAMIHSLCTEIFGKAMSAQMAIGELPYANLELEQTAAFVAKVGDYAYALSRSTSSSGYSEDELTTLQSLSENATSLSQQLIGMEADLTSGSISLEDVNAARLRLSSETESGNVNGGTIFQDIEREFPEMPTLIYDGPFSEHIQSRTPAMLEGLPEVTEEEALEAVASFTGLKKEIFSLAATIEGQLPSYLFTATVDGGEMTIEVTRQGGKVYQVFHSRIVPAATLSFQEAIDTAKEFLEAQGYPDMAESYYMDEGNVLAINFAAETRGVICYPDLVKVSVALDNGRIVGFESEGYLMNHQERILPQPTVTLEEAQSNLSPLLTLLSCRLALIPTDGENELLCYELKCETESGQHCIVYRNARTGTEERILLLLEDENGTLTL